LKSAVHLPVAPKQTEAIRLQNARDCTLVLQARLALPTTDKIKRLFKRRAPGGLFLKGTCPDAPTRFRCRLLRVVNSYRLSGVLSCTGTLAPVLEKERYQEFGSRKTKSMPNFSLPPHSNLDGIISQENRAQ
jgi:hypothetical protein